MLEGCSHDRLKQAVQFGLLGADAGVSVLRQRGDVSGLATAYIGSTTTTSSRVKLGGRPRLALARMAVKSKYPRLSLVDMFAHLCTVKEGSPGTVYIAIKDVLEIEHRFSRSSAVICWREEPLCLPGCGIVKVAKPVLHRQNHNL